MTLILVPAEVHDEFAAQAAKIVPGVDFVPYTEDDQPVTRVGEADAILRWVLGQRFARLIEAAPNVRWLHTASAGVDHILTPAVRSRHGLIVTDSGPAFEIAIPEFVLAWMLMIARRLPDLLASQRARRWEWVQQRELYGATVGIIGLGPIGQGVAKRARAFGMRTLGFRRKNLPVSSVDEILTGTEGLDKLLAESDYIVIAAALTADTTSIIGAEQLAKMKPDSWIINIARGAMIDQDALTDALVHKRIGGACLDVFAKEPLPQESKLWDLPNVTISPHNSGGGSDALRLRQRSIFLENLKRFVNGQPLDNVVDIEAGY
jgi:phosphoglycerate dehydrogenase-like enzyme